MDQPHVVDALDRSGAALSQSSDAPADTYNVVDDGPLTKREYAQDAGMGTNPPGWLVLMVQSNLAHDVVLVPAVLLVGVVVARFVPPAVRAPVQGGLIATGVIVLFAFPFVRGYGIKPDNPTVLPQDYGRGLLLVLGVVWLVTAAITLGRMRLRRGEG